MGPPALVNLINIVNILSFFWAPAKLSSYIPELHIRAYADIKEEVAKACLNEYGGEYYTKDINRIFNDSHIDAIIIATWHNTHTDYAIRSAQAGKHILMEKPLALTVKELSLIHI